MDIMQQTGGASIPVKVSHLGVTLGNENKGRVIALATSEVYHDSALISSFLHTSPSNLDNGFQAHLYTGPSDTFVVYLPETDENIVQRSFECVTANSDIWKTLTGITLAKENVIIGCNNQKIFTGNTPDGFQVRKGTHIQVAAEAAAKTGKAFVVFVFSEKFLQKSGLNFPPDHLLWEYARTTESLMDKNSTVRLLQKNRVPVPETIFSGKNEPGIDKSQKYVFKPSGGAAGLGVYLNNGNGAGWDELRRHIKNLKKNHLLPVNYQIQEFIPGLVYGALVQFVPGKKPEILQIHSQTINRNNKFIAGSWTPETQHDKFGITDKLVRQIAAIKEIRFIGLMGIDIIDGKIIEINPRITASSPVSHLLSMEKAIRDFRGLGFKIKRVDINAGIPVPAEMIGSGTLKKEIFNIWKKHRVMVLPQGLNPAGNSRILFINDTIKNSAQQEFLQNLNSSQKNRKFRRRNYRN